MRRTGRVQGLMAKGLALCPHQASQAWIVNVQGAGLCWGGGWSGGTSSGHSGGREGVKGRAGGTLWSHHSSASLSSSPGLWELP